MITRRNFLRSAALGAAGVAIKGSCLILEGSKYPVAKIPEVPVTVELMHGYLCNSAGFVPEDMPTVAQHHGFPDMTLAEKVVWGLEQLSAYGIEEGTVEWKNFCAGWDVNTNKKKWSKKGKEDFFEGSVRETIGDKDELAEVETLSPQECLRCGEYAAGLMVLDALDTKTAQRLGLYLVEGEMPGADFWGVKFEGSVSDLNDALRETGLSIIVSEAVK